MKNLDLSLVIISYNTKDLTLQTLKSIYDHTSHISFEVILVDNASSDGSVTAVREQFPNVQIFPQDNNLGFGKANNLGAKQATGKYLGFFNSDIIVNSVSINPLITYLEKNARCGIVAPKILLEDGQTIQPGSFGPEPSLLNLLFREQHKSNKLFLNDHELSIDWVTGAAFCIKREIFNSLGGFDEKIFMYYEDIDLCHRVREASYTVIWLPEATLIHLGGRSSTSNWKRKKMYYAAQSYYMRKHYGWTTSAMLSILRLPMVLRHRFHR